MAGTVESDRQTDIFLFAGFFKFCALILFHKCRLLKLPVITTQINLLLIPEPASFPGLIEIKRREEVSASSSHSSFSRKVVCRPNRRVLNSAPSKVQDSQSGCAYSFFVTVFPDRASICAALQCPSNPACVRRFSFDAFPAGSDPI